MGEDQPSTEELRTVQRKVERSEREAAEQAPTEHAERTHERRADKASYLEEKLAEQERSDRG